MNSMKLYIFACLCSLILWGVSCDEESVGIPTGALYLGIEEDATLLTKAESAVTNESLRVDIIAAEGDTIKSYSDYDGTNFMFINPQMSTFPTDGKVSIRLENGAALDEINARI